MYILLTRVYVPLFGDFLGSGKNSKSDPIFKISDPAARSIQENFGMNFKFVEDDFFGPINGLVLTKI